MFTSKSTSNNQKKTKMHFIIGQLIYISVLAILLFSFIYTIEKLYITSLVNLLFIILFLSIFVLVAKTKQITFFLPNKKIYIYIILVSLTFITRSIWMFLVDIIPMSDFKIYNDFAVLFSRPGPHDSWYGSVFPHIMGYAFLNSIFYKLFGIYKIIPLILNLSFSIGISIAIYKISSHIQTQKVGFVSAILFILLPQSIFYTNFIATEIPFTFLFLMSILLFMKILNNTSSLYVNIALYFILGVLCEITNFIRPMGTLLVAIFIFTFSYKTINKKYKFKLTVLSILTFLIVFIFAYFATTNIISYEISKHNNEPISTFPMGYNLLVGSNISSNGTWNPEDSKLLFSYTNLPAQQIHNILFAKGLERFKNHGISNIQLFINKFIIVWTSTDSESIYNMRAGYNPSSAFDVKKHSSTLFLICNIFYLSLLFFSIFFVFKTLKSRNSHPLLIVISIFVIGVVIIHLLFEASGRYNFIVAVLLTVTASNGIFHLRNLKTN